MIKVRDLTFGYTKNMEALKNISLDIKKGKWISIIGHNGSGKSTLAKILVGLLEPNSGEVTIDDILINEENISEIRKKIGIVFQNPDNQFVGVTVKHDIAFGLENQNLSSKEIKEKVLEYATFVGMEEYLEKEPHLLSGGQKQRVAIAGALAMQQDYIILDEATSMLDPSGTLEIVDLIKKVSEDKNKTIISITHDLNIANMSDYIFVLKDGELFLEGEPNQVFIECEKLKEAHLEIPYALDVHNQLKEAHANKKLVDALWDYHLKK